jgi:hypothetical protein
MLRIYLERRMDINAASAEELQRAFEVDAGCARFIIEKRDQLGGFKNWEQIIEIVPGIEGKMAANLQGVQDPTLRCRQEARRECDTSGHKSTIARKTNLHEQQDQVCQIDAEHADYFSQEPGSLDLWSSPEGRLIFTLAMFMS